ncbi:MAG: ATP synthase F1 subunit delta [Acidobacteriota bacterium]|nr:ATP synthase F1 subunit delta [Acidobacteriota bacterium]
MAEAAHLDAAVAQQQLQDLADTLAGSSALREIFMNPSVPMNQKLNVLDALVSRMGVDPKVRNFLAVVLEHNRLHQFDEIRAEYRELANQHDRAVEATITTARPLEPQDRLDLEAQASKLAGAMIRASYVEDPSLLGGAVVQIGSTIYDGSLRAQLQQLKQRMIHA